MWGVLAGSLERRATKLVYLNDTGITDEMRTFVHFRKRMTEFKT